MPITYLTKEDERKARVKKIINGRILEKNVQRNTTADKAGVGRHILYDVLKNHAEDMKLRDLWRILDALEVPEEERARILM